MQQAVGHAGKRMLIACGEFVHFRQPVLDRGNEQLFSLQIFEHLVAFHAFLSRRVAAACRRAFDAPQHRLNLRACLFPGGDHGRDVAQLQGTLMCRQTRRQKFFDLAQHAIEFRG